MNETNKKTHDTSYPNLDNSINVFTSVSTRELRHVQPFYFINSVFVYIYETIMDYVVQRFV